MRRRGVVRNLVITEVAQRMEAENKVLGPMLENISLDVNTESIVPSTWLQTRPIFKHGCRYLSRELR